MGESSLIEEIKRQVSVTDLASCRSNGYVECPDPSCLGHAKGKIRCRVKSDRWRCFYCGRGGDIFEWVIASRDCDFKSAFHELAMQAGISLRTNDERAGMLRKVVAASSRYLMEHPELREYLEHRRGIPKSLIFRHQLGYVDRAGEVLASCGLTELELLQLGFLTKPWPGDKHYRSVMADRYLLPIRNKWGDVVHVRGRINPDVVVDPKCPKLLSLATRSDYAPDTWMPLSTSEFFYLEDNIERAKVKGYVVIAEGEFDAHIAEALGHPAIGVLGNDGFLRLMHKLKGIATIYDARDNDQATEDKMPRHLFEMQMSSPGQVIRRVRIPYLRGHDENGLGLKVDLTDYVVEFNKSRQDFKDLLAKAPSAYSILTETYAPDYQKDESFMKLKRLWHTASKEFQARMLKRMVTLTGEPEDKLAFALAPGLAGSHA